jgi:hypothetical protein
MKRLNWQIVLGIALIILSLFFCLIHYAIFRDAHFIFLWLLTDIAFIPIQVLLVTLIINQLLSMREKRSLLEKLNMIIGAFFSEVGTKLLTYFSDFDPQLEKIKKELMVANNWSEKEFFSINKRLKNYDYGVDIKRVDLENLRNFLVKRREFMLRLLENPNLLEHESFTALLWAVFHLTEELANRKKIEQLPGTDLEHLASDIKRAYIILVHQWLDYMKHLKNNYPYLFSLAMRTNPFDENASPIVK